LSPHHTRAFAVRTAGLRRTAILSKSQRVAFVGRGICHERGLEIDMMRLL
jgi:hypothetical protein